MKARIKKMVDTPFVDLRLKFSLNWSGKPIALTRMPTIKVKAPMIAANVIVFVLAGI